MVLLRVTGGQLTFEPAAPELVSALHDERGQCSYALLTKPSKL